MSKDKQSEVLQIIDYIETLIKNLPDAKDLETEINRVDEKLENIDNKLNIIIEKLNL